MSHIMSDMVLPTLKSHEIQASLRCSSIASLRAVISNDDEIVSTYSTEGYLLFGAYERVHDDRNGVPPFCFRSITVLFPKPAIRSCSSTIISSNPRI